jgi:hypothetical protein
MRQGWLKTLAMMLLVAGLSGLSIPAQALYYLDNFSQPTSDWSVTSSSTGVPATHLDTGINVVGGSRFSSVTKDSGAETAYLILSSGFLTFSSDTATQGSFFLLYTANGAGLNLDFSPVNSLTVQYYTDHVNYVIDTQLKITITDNMGKISFLNKTFPDNTPLFTWLNVVFNISQFNSDTGFNLAKINSLRLDYIGDSNNTAAFGYIATDVSPGPGAEPKTIGPQLFLLLLQD